MFGMNADINYILIYNRDSFMLTIHSKLLMFDLIIINILLLTFLTIDSDKVQEGQWQQDKWQADKTDNALHQEEVWTPDSQYGGGPGGFLPFFNQEVWTV